MRTNADTPHDARQAREFGAQGIGLCRTEHMFFGEDRIMKMREMILADGLIDRHTTIAKGTRVCFIVVEPEALAGFFHASLAADIDATPLATGLPASPGAASGRISASSAAVCGCRRS